MKRAAADFMAVFIAEEYRNLVATKGKRLKQGDWDNSHLQTTMLGSFHSGQTARRGMFFEGKLVEKTYATFDCVYKSSDRKGKQARTMKLRDYTQVNKECKRSGVGMTKGDWSRLTRAIGNDLRTSSETRELQRAFGTSDANGIETAALAITDDRNDGGFGSNARAMVRASVDYLMAAQKRAAALTAQLFGGGQSGAQGGGTSANDQFAGPLSGSFSVTLRVQNEDVNPTDAASLTSLVQGAIGSFNASELSVQPSSDAADRDVVARFKIGTPTPRDTLADALEVVDLDIVKIERQ